MSLNASELVLQARLSHFGLRREDPVICPACGGMVHVTSKAVHRPIEGTCEQCGAEWSDKTEWKPPFCNQCGWPRAEHFTHGCYPRPGDCPAHPEFDGEQEPAVVGDIHSCPMCGDIWQRANVGK